MNFVKEINQNFESSSGTTPQWKSFYRKSLNHFKKILGDVAENIQMSRGHFEFSGFLTVKKTGKIFYFSISDVRHFPFPADKLLIRTAEHYKDYTGGSNCYVSIDENMETNIKRMILN